MSEPRDSELRHDLDRAIEAFNNAVREAYRAGLKVEIRPTTYSGTDEPFLHKCEVWRPIP